MSPAQKQASRRDPAVELFRIIACLLVIGLHTMPEAEVFYGTWNNAFNRFLRVLLSDAVAMFWLMSGFYLFREGDWGRLCRRTLKRIVLPAAAIAVFTFYFREWMCIEGTTLRESVTHSLGEYLGVLRDTLALRSGVAGAAHLWYVFTYFIVILCQPLLKAADEYLAADVRRERRFVLITLALRLLNDLDSNGVFGSGEGFAGLPTTVILLLWGSILYRRRERLESLGRKLLLAVPAYLAMDIVRALFLHMRAEAGKSIWLMYWNSTPGMVGAVLMALICFGLIRQDASEGLRRRLSWLSSYTFPVYLTHLLLRDSMVYRFHVDTALQALMPASWPAWLR